jgi:hypothetical protein
MVGPDGRLLVWGVELRYLLTWYLVESGSVLSVGDLVRFLQADGLGVEGPANKVVSDALRWEIRKRRVVRVARGRYRCGVMPRQTKSRIRSRTAVVRHAAFAQRRDTRTAGALRR